MRHIFSLGVVAAAALALAAATLASSAQVVGAALRDGATEAFVAVNAHGTAAGTAADGTARITTDEWEATIGVTCIRHVGDTVLVGGLVTETSAPAGPGWGAVIVIADGGHGVRDQVGFGFEPPPPTTSTDCSVDPSIFPLAPVLHGNFAVK